MIAVAELIQKNLFCLPTTTVHLQFPYNKEAKIIFLFKLKDYAQKTSTFICPRHIKYTKWVIFPQEKQQQKSKPCRAVEKKRRNTSLLLTICTLRNRKESHHRSKPVKTWQGFAEQEKLANIHILTRYSALLLIKLFLLSCLIKPESHSIARHISQILLPSFTMSFLCVSLAQCYTGSNST